MPANFRKFTAEEISLQWHDELNPRLWEGDSLKPEVRQRLLAFADAWVAFAKIPPSLIQDVLLTGGNCNFSYTPYSDLDVHVLIDRTQLGAKTLVDDYLKSMKKLWSLTHDPRVAGYPIEPYAQDVTEVAHEGQGVYSLKRGEWVQKPAGGRVDMDTPTLESKVAHWKSVIDHVVDGHASDSQILQVKKRLADMRKSAIAKSGEFATENLVFKELRNLGYLQRLSDALRRAQDSALSL